jgi:hypothetical protein
VDPLRKAEVRLAEHGELRDALGLRKAPEHTHHALPRFMRRLDEQALVAALNETVSVTWPRRAVLSSGGRGDSSDDCGRGDATLGWLRVR